MLVSLVFISALSTASYSQSFQWIQSGGGAETPANSNLREKLTNMVADNFGNIYGLSYVTTPNLMIAGNPKISYAPFGIYSRALVSFDCAGNYRWSKILSSCNGNANYTNLVCDSQGNVNCTYHIGSGLNQVHFDSPEIFPFVITTIGNETIFNLTSFGLIKYDTNGVELWKRNLEGNFISSDINNKTNKINYIWNMVIDAQDNLYLDAGLYTGTFFNGAYVNNQVGVLVNYDAVSGTSRHIIKLNNQGLFVSGFPIDMPVYGFQNAKMVRNPVNGDFYFAGAYNQYTYPNSPPSFSGIVTDKIASKFILAYNNQGAYLWHVFEDVATTFAVTQTDTFTDIETDEQGNVYVTGNVSGDRGLNEPGAGIYTIGGFTFPVDTDCYTAALPIILKFNSLGQPLLETHPRYQTGGILNNITINGNEIAKTQSFLGLRWQDRVLPEPTSVRPPGGLVRFNKDTFKLIDLNFAPATSTDNFVPWSDIICDHLGNYYLGGTITDQATVNGNTVFTNGGETDFCIVKFGTNNCNCQVPTCRFATSAGKSATSVAFLYQGQNVYDTVSWNFGDNSTSSDVNPTHTYATPGVYNVCVTATNSCDSFQFCKLVDTTTLGSDTFIEDFSANLEISPNPAFGNTTIAYDATQVPVIEVYDLAGRLITKHEPTLQKGTWQLPLETVAQGMYLVVLTENGVVKMQKKLLVK